MGRHLLLSDRKQKWGARALLVTLYTCVLAGICYGLYQVPVHADEKGHHPKHIWPISSFHLLSMVGILAAYLVVLALIVIILTKVIPNLHEAAEWD